MHPQSRAHTIIELVDYGEHARRKSETLEDSQQKGAVDRAICFREVDKTHVQRNALSLLHFLQSAYHKSHADGRASRPEVASLLW